MHGLSAVLFLISDFSWLHRSKKGMNEESIYSCDFYQTNVYDCEAVKHRILCKKQHRCQKSSASLWLFSTWNNYSLKTIPVVTKRFVMITKRIIGAQRDSYSSLRHLPSYLSGVKSNAKKSLTGAPLQYPSWILLVESTEANWNAHQSRSPTDCFPRILEPSAGATNSTMNHALEVYLILPTIVLSTQLLQ